MLKLSEVKSILREYNIHPSKRLGQNFLIDQNIKNKIIGSIRVSEEDTVLEIGPGFGALTEDLAKKAKRLVAIEKDRRLYDFLVENLSCSNIKLINGDILQYDLSNFASCRTATCEVGQVIVGNLPYSISSPILNHLINNRTCIKSAYVTVQMEFGERVSAFPGTKDYGSLSCYAQFYGVPKILFKIPRGAFYPVPEVDSCFLKIDFGKEIDASIDQAVLFKIIRSSFEKRRKTILNSLSSSDIFKSKEEALKCLEKSHISPGRRPETVSLTEFITLSRSKQLDTCDIV
ncbi:MAG: 16S rRNA (adenine(1518)-N(6)/adenine(1519)-N(6))-dimethyltransferase RsmA [Candidatus Omnitrophota bacterium]|nr:16S rRNA (adenine(1518)-N(6)/adenine(1519)-N(6))-dimethyltransferase RsmA [Candidatus Omnitrophota bacterium]